MGAARREVEEEVGLSELEPLEPGGSPVFDVDIHPIPARGTDPSHHHFDLRFALRTAAGERFLVSSESR